MTLTVRLDTALESALDRYSGERKVTKSHVVQEALAQYLTSRMARDVRVGETSENYRAFERAGLIGCVAGDGRSATKDVVRERAKQRIARNWR